MDTFELGSAHPTAVVSAGATIGLDVTIGAFSIVHPGVRLGAGTVVGSHCVIGEPVGTYYEGEQATPSGTVVGANSIIRSHSVIYQGVNAGPRLRTGHRVTLREGSRIGSDVQIGTMSDLQGNLTIGDHVRMHSNVHVGQLTIVEDFVWLFPSVILTNDPHPPSDTCTQGATVRSFAVVATKAVIMPGVEIGRHALVGAMSLVTVDVAPETVVVGVPARPAGSVRDVQCRHGKLDAVYPWPIQFRRGYPDGALPDADLLG